MNVVEAIAAILEDEAPPASPPVANTWLETNSGAAGTSLTLSGYTVGGSGANRALIVIASAADRFGTQDATIPTGVTFGGAAMTKLVDAANPQESSFEIGTSIWFLMNPTASTADIVATWGETQNRRHLAAVWVSGCKATAPNPALTDITETISNLTAISTTITGVPNNSLMIDGFANEDGATIAVTESGQVQRASADVSFGRFRASDRTVVTGGNLAMGWSLGTAFSRAAQAVAVLEAP